MKFLASPIVLAAFCWTVAASAAQQPLNQHVKDTNDVFLQNVELDQYIRDTMDEWHAPGLAVSVVQGNDTWAKGYGYASLPSTKITPHTLFFTGSTTKSFTAAALSLLIDNSSNYSSVQWATPMSQLLREDFVLSDEWATDHITIEDVLSHRTGYPPHHMAFASATRDLVRKLRYLPMSAEPRVRLQYNNKMYAAAGYLITTLAGSSLGAFFRTYLWEPMGMNETFMGLYDPMLQSSGLVLAEEYYYKNSTDEYLCLDHADLLSEEGAGAVISNVLDYAKYLRVMINKEKPISEAGHRELRTARSFFDGTVAPFVGPLTYSLGWMSGIFEGEQVWLHSGQVNQFTTWLLMVPSRKIGITVMTNSASNSMTLVLYRILYDLFGVKDEDRFDFAAKFKKDIEKRRYYSETCSTRLYPDLPTPPLPFTVPLKNHTGTFRDAGYGDVDVVLSCGDSSATRMSWPPTDESCQLQVRKAEGGPFNVPFVFNLEHKSGDYWLGWTEVWDKDEPAACFEFRFRIDAKGVVSHLGFNFGEQGQPIIFFERVET